MIVMQNYSTLSFCNWTAQLLPWSQMSVLQHCWAPHLSIVCSNAIFFPSFLSRHCAALCIEVV